MAKKKPSYMQRRQKDEVNKKAIMWVGSLFVIIVAVMSILLILDK